MKSIQNWNLKVATMKAVYAFLLIAIVVTMSPGIMAGITADPKSIEWGTKLMDSFLDLLPKN